MNLRRIGFLVALLVLALGLTACGVSNTIDPVATAATKTQNAGGAKLAFSATISSPALPTPMTLSGEGVVDGDRGEVTLDMSQLLAQAGAPALSGATVREVFLKEDGNLVLYMESPLFAAFLPGGKRWLRLDVQKAGKKLGFDFNDLMGAASQNPAQALDMLQASGDFDNVGAETIGGASTTHYRGTVDLADLAAKQGVSGDALEHVMELGAQGRMPIDVWIGDDGLVRQVELTSSGKQDGVEVSVAIKIGMSDFGSTVSVTAPPAGEVFDATELATKGLQSLPTATRTTTA